MGGEGVVGGVGGGCGRGGGVVVGGVGGVVVGVGRVNNAETCGHFLFLALQGWEAATAELDLISG